MKFATSYPKRGGTMYALIISIAISCSSTHNIPMSEKNASNHLFAIPSIQVLKKDTIPIVNTPVKRTIDNSALRKQWQDLMERTNKAFTQIDHVSDNSNEIKTVSLQILKQNIILFNQKDSIFNELRTFRGESKLAIDSLKKENRASFKKIEEAKKAAIVEKNINKTTYSMFDIIITIAVIITLIASLTHLLMDYYRYRPERKLVI